MLPIHRQSSNRRRHASGRRRRGAAMIEFALCLPILLLLVFGIMEIGRALMVYQILTNGAREGARLAIIPGSTDAKVTSKIDTYMTNAGISGHTRQVSPSIGASNSGDAITITVSVPFNQVMWGTDFIGIGGTTFTSSVVMRKE